MLNTGLILRLCVELARDGLPLLETQSPELAVHIWHVLAASLIHSGKHGGHQSLWLLDFGQKTINASKLTETPNALREVSKISCRLQIHMMDYHAQAMCIICAFSETCSQGTVYTPVALLNEIRNHTSIAQCYGPANSQKHYPHR